MEYEHVIHGLLRKRQEVADALDLAQGRVRQLVLDIDAVDATLRLFQPDIEVGIVRVRPTPRRHGVQPGETSKLVLSLLRENGPLSQRQLTLKVMEHRGLNVADAVLRGVMRNWVGASLRGMKKRGTLTGSEGRGAGIRWGLLEPT